MGTHGRGGRCSSRRPTRYAPGDTIWGIAEEYCAKNTGTRRYILEYKAGMEELNPWLVERKGGDLPRG